MKNRALFLDRDGVINRDDGYVFEIEKFVFLDGIFELAGAAKALGYLSIVVTNQAGIGRGYYSEDDFFRLSDWMKGGLRDRRRADRRRVLLSDTSRARHWPI